MPGCTPPATTARSAALRGRAVWADRCAAMAYTSASDTRPMRLKAPPESVHARVHPPAPRGSGGCSHGIHASCRGGLCGAAHLGAGCRSVAALPREPPRARGARYALAGESEAGSAGRRGRQAGRRARSAVEGLVHQPPEHEAGCEDDEEGQDDLDDVGEAWKPATVAAAAGGAVTGGGLELSHGDGVPFWLRVLAGALTRVGVKGRVRRRRCTPEGVHGRRGMSGY